MSVIARIVLSAKICMHSCDPWLISNGRARITAIDQDGRNFVDDVGEGDLWYFPAGIPHSIQGLEEGCEFLLVFDDGSFSENSTFLISDWFAHTPRDVLAKNFGVSESDFADIPSHELYIFQTRVPAHYHPTGSLHPMVPYRRVSDTACWRRNQCGLREGLCVSLTPPIFPSPLPLRRRWWRLSQEG